MPDRPYLFYELTNSLCPHCFRKVEAKVVFQDGRVYLIKHCPEHRAQRVLISTDVEYYQRARAFLKPGQMPLKWNTRIERGCPWDCGLCPDHEQHGCLTLLEITDACNLRCPVCYAASAPGQRHRPLEEIERMLDRIVENEGRPDVVQISGGEPTLHPDFFRVLDLAKARPIKHLMVNTNGVRLAASEDLVARLSGYKPGFEIYLQFDSLEPDPQLALRGEDLREVRLRALDRLNAHDISTTLVVTLRKGLNDREIGRILSFALEQPCVRGVTFQPVQVAGRTEGFDPARDRLTLAEVRQQILAQHDLFAPEDIVPVPCHPDCIAMAYALKVDGRAAPLTRFVGTDVLLGGGGNTIHYESDPMVRGKLFELLSTAHSPGSAAASLGQLLCCLPQVELPSAVSYRNVFRVIIMQFLDAWNFDVRSVKRSCVHIAHPDGRIIPFDTYNLFYRPGLAPPVVMPDASPLVPLSGRSYPGRP
jgi:7,8-dihydro-6-hydroxymethylpterin dimethyltransferase